MKYLKTLCGLSTRFEKSKTEKQIFNGASPLKSNQGTDVDKQKILLSQLPSGFRNR